jgi:hypothetical protein
MLLDLQRYGRDRNRTVLETTNHNTSIYVQNTTYTVYSILGLCSI